MARSDEARSEVITPVESMLDAVLGGSRSDQAVVNLLYNNLTGLEPTPGELDYLVRLLDDGVYSQTSLAVEAANHPLNTGNIDLIGLAETGVEFYAAV